MPYSLASLPLHKSFLTMLGLKNTVTVASGLGQADKMMLSTVRYSKFRKAGVSQVGADWNFSPTHIQFAVELQNIR